MDDRDPKGIRAIGISSSDADVIAASRQDPERFALIFDRYFDAIHRYLRRRVGRASADDLTAEAFVIAFRRRESYDVARSDAGPWLFGIAANLVRRHSRKERRELRAYARTGVDPIQDEIADAESRIDSVAAGRQLADALASLSRDDREVLLLYAWADLSYQEIADGLAIPLGTVRSRLARARRKVRELLSAKGAITG